MDIINIRRYNACNPITRTIAESTPGGNDGNPDTSLFDPAGIIYGMRRKMNRHACLFPGHPGHFFPQHINAVIDPGRHFDARFINMLDMRMSELITDDESRDRFAGRYGQQGEPEQLARWSTCEILDNPSSERFDGGEFYAPPDILVTDHPESCVLTEPAMAGRVAVMGTHVMVSIYIMAWETNNAPLDTFYRYTLTPEVYDREIHLFREKNFRMISCG